ncbi:MAG: SPOR domain-containing protein [Magnetococcales bacterium]|nr:SPOR domain-containing protein [Magnetococcales bacterium]
MAAEKTDTPSSDHAIVLESMDLRTQDGVSRLQARQPTRLEPVGVASMQNREQREFQGIGTQAAPDDQNLTEAILMGTINRLTAADPSSTTAAGETEDLLLETMKQLTFQRSSEVSEGNDASPSALQHAIVGLSVPDNAAGTTAAFDTLMEEYTSSILADRFIPERVQRAVAKIFRRYLPVATLVGVNTETAADIPTAAPLPAANAVQGGYPPQWPLLRNGPYLVHLGAFHDQLDCRQLAEELAHANVPSWVDKVRTPDGLHIVRLLVGPFATYDDVLHTVKAIQRQTGLLAGWTHNPYYHEEWYRP